MAEKLVEARRETVARGAVKPLAEGWWEASDGRWYPPAEGGTGSSPWPAPAAPHQRVVPDGDHWYSRKPKEERRPLLSGRLFWNFWEFRHPVKVAGAAVIAVFGLIFVIGTIVAVVAVIGADDDAPGDVGSAPAEVPLEGTLTGRLDATFPLGGGDVTVRAAEVRLPDGRVVDADLAPGVTADLTAGGTVYLIETPRGEYGWRITEIVPLPVDESTASGDVAPGTASGAADTEADAPEVASAPADDAEAEADETPAAAVTALPDSVTIGITPWDDGLGPEVVESVLTAVSVDVGSTTEADPDTLVMMLQFGDIDVIASGLVIEERFTDQILMSNPGLCEGEVLLVPPGNPLGLTDLASVAATGATVGYIDVDTYYPGWLDAAGIGEAQRAPFPFQELTAQYELIVTGELDAIVILASVPMWGEYAPELTAPAIESTPISFPSSRAGAQGPERCLGYGFADADLLEAFNEELAGQLDSGQIGAIHAEYGFHAIETEVAIGVTVEQLVSG